MAPAGPCGLRDRRAAANPAMHHSVEREALAYAMLPLPCDRLGTGEETTYFTADCALIHGYRLHPWIASYPSNGLEIRLHDAQRAMGPEAGHENGEPIQSLRPLTWVLQAAPTGPGI